MWEDVVSKAPQKTLNIINNRNPWMRLRHNIGHIGSTSCRSHCQTGGRTELAEFILIVSAVFTTSNVIVTLHLIKIVFKKKQKKHRIKNKCVNNWCISDFFSHRPTLEITCYHCSNLTVQGLQKDQELFILKYQFQFNLKKYLITFWKYHLVLVVSCWIPIPLVASRDICISLRHYGQQ